MEVKRSVKEEDIIEGCQAISKQSERVPPAGYDSHARRLIEADRDKSQYYQRPGEPPAFPFFSLCIAYR